MTVEIAMAFAFSLLFVVFFFSKKNQDTHTKNLSYIKQQRKISKTCIWFFFFFFCGKHKIETLTEKPNIEYVCIPRRMILAIDEKEKQISSICLWFCVRITKKKIKIRKVTEIHEGRRKNGEG